MDQNLSNIIQNLQIETIIITQKLKAIPSTHSGHKRRL